jgi:Na+/H+ antiporter NhaD/arsenite permease-like protein
MERLSVEYAVFLLALIGIALFHGRALYIVIAALVAVMLLQIATAPSAGTAVQELGAHFLEEGVVLANLLLLLLGFAILSSQFERSHLPQAIPSWLPRGWMGGVALLGIVFVLSSFLDNIAGAVIGGIVARYVYQNRVTVGFLAAIVSASNAGGAGSVIGDTTTTMMWISGISPLELLPAFIGAIGAFAVFAPLAAFSQQKRSPALPRTMPDVEIDWVGVVVVFLVLLALVATNVTVNGVFPGLEDMVPALGLGLWLAILATSLVRSPGWTVLREAFKGALFLVALVALASLMPVDRLPPPSVLSTLGLGFLSAVFDNIPLTALALNQGGYDWALLAYAVGFGGSMVWFGSSAGVALTNLFPEGRSVLAWLREAWFVPLSYVVGFVLMLLTSSRP